MKFGCMGHIVPIIELHDWRHFSHWIFRQCAGTASHAHSGLGKYLMLMTSITQHHLLRFSTQSFWWLTIFLLQWMPNNWESLTGRSSTTTLPLAPIRDSFSLVVAVSLTFDREWSDFFLTSLSLQSMMSSMALTLVTKRWDPHASHTAN